MGFCPKYLAALFKRFGDFPRLNENRVRPNCVQSDSALVFCGKGLAHPGAVCVQVTWAEVVLGSFSLQERHLARTALNVYLASFSDNADFSKRGFG